jgi:hypothetical protein
VRTTKVSLVAREDVIEIRRHVLMECVSTSTRMLRCTLIDSIARYTAAFSLVLHRQSSGTLFVGAAP